MAVELLLRKYSITPTGLIPEVPYVLWLLLYLPSSFCSVYLASSTLLAQSKPVLDKLPLHCLQVSVPHKPLVLMVSSKDPATYIAFTLSFLTLLMLDTLQNLFQ
jgi:hypothetical protein